MKTSRSKPSFSMGQVVATPACLQLLLAHGVTPKSLLERHHCGDGGDLDRSDQKANAHALITGERLLSAYKVGAERIYIITDAVSDYGGAIGRASTTLMLASEY